jgi:ribosome-associated toxin RatA of RatAB toxin-antitoxin module
MPAGSPAAPRRRRRRWLIIPLVLFILLIALTAWTYVRGTWADTQPRHPEAINRPVCQLYRDPDGKTWVRAVVLLRHPTSAVWAVVTDYAHYDQFLPYLDNIQVTPMKDGAHMKGDARSVVAGYWPFTLDVHETRDGEVQHAEWDAEPGEQVLVNRGGWTVRETTPDETLLELRLEAEVKGYPTFILRNMFLHRLPLVLDAVEQRLKKETKQ